MEIKRPYLVFLGDVPDQLAAKTATGIVDWRRDWCVGQMRLPGCGADTGLPDMGLDEAREKGAETLVIGIVNAGGVLPDHWVTAIVEAIEKGFDIASGLHAPLQATREIRIAAEKHGVNLHNVRLSEQKFRTGQGTKRQGLRLLTIGTDCSIGKKYTALAIEAEMVKRGHKADFRATGQTGVFISGRGVSIDAVVADFISGAAEWIAPENEPDHWDIVEGQGSLFHPSFAGVSLGLLHGAQPDALILCHEPTRKTMRNVPTPMPKIEDVIDLALSCGRLTNPNVACTGIAVNTAALDENEARGCINQLAEEHGLPATDPVRFGVGPLIDALEERFGKPK